MRRRFVAWCLVTLLAGRGGNGRYCETEAGARECAADQKGDHAKVVEDYGLALAEAARQVGISIVWTYCAFLSHNDFVSPSSVRRLLHGTDSLSRTVCS